MIQRARRGFGLVGIILVILILTGVGVVISYLARHADKSGRWFQHSQMAFGLADAGVKQALYLLSQQNSKALAGGTQPAGAALTQAFDALTGGQVGAAVTLFSSSNAGQLPAGLTAQIEPLTAEFSPTLEVTFEVLENGPLWDGLVDGLPIVEGEHRGIIRITSKASVKTPVGVRIERTLTLEKGFKVVSILPPLLGRFGLFIDPRVLPDPNTFTVRYDPATGDGVPEAGNVPVILRSQFVAPMVAKGTTTLDRAGFASGIQDPKFLDHQGWVYLGSGQVNAEWTLKLAHGYGNAGESPLLLGDRVLVKFRGSDDPGFRKRFDDAFAANALQGCQSDLENEKNQTEGLEHFSHGWASNYEIIGLDAASYPLVGGGSNRTAMDFGSGVSSALRPYGTPDALSPTIVFGKAYASLIRRASIHALVGPPEFCATSGLFRFNLFKLTDHVAGFQTVLSAAFAGAYPQWGTAVEEFPYADALNILLSGQGNGEYTPEGFLGRTDGGGAVARSYASDYFPWVSGLGTQSGIPASDIDALLNGRLEQPKIFSGNLSTGLKAFQAAMTRKTTYEVRSEAFGSRLLVGADKKQLSIPGVVLLKGEAAGATLTIPAGVTVQRGGILIADGPIQIQGDIRRSAPVEPLTLVSLTGDITVAAGATEVQAYLVSLAGKVDIQAAGCVVSGGVACRELNFDALRALPAPVVLAHAQETDPTGPQRQQSLRVFYGGEDRIVAAGSGP